ncbi:UNVERIFIED_CONTAM: Protein-tyrosine-phosphatase PTP1 [Sesamum indicum]
MATTSSKTPSTTDTAVVAASPAAPNSFDSTMQRLPLSVDQLRHCSEALECFKARKCNSPQTIRQEFQTLQEESSQIEVRDPHAKRVGSRKDLVRRDVLELMGFQELGLYSCDGYGKCILSGLLARYLRSYSLVPWIYNVLGHALKYKIEELLPESQCLNFQLYCPANRTRASDMINRCTVALDSLNYSKNRYTDVLPFDDNRVILKQCTDYRSSARGYINASFVTDQYLFCYDAIIDELESLILDSNSCGRS